MKRAHPLRAITHVGTPIAQDDPRTRHPFSFPGSNASVHTKVLRFSQEVSAIFRHEGHHGTSWQPLALLPSPGASPWCDAPDERATIHADILEAWVTARSRTSTSWCGDQTRISHSMGSVHCARGLDSRNAFGEIFISSRRARWKRSFPCNAGVGRQRRIRSSKCAT